MNLKTYYQKIREITETLVEDYIVVKSIATEAGGLAGRLTEVGKATAARMLADGVAEAASAKEASAMRAAAEEARRKEEERRRAAHVQFTVVSESDLRALARSGRARKE